MISFNSLIKDFHIPQPSAVKEWLNNVILQESKKTGQIQYVFCADEYLSEINLKYLSHSTLTDVITFPGSTNTDIISGEVYISIDRIRENAIDLDLAFELELLRVMVHGVLHLIGYEDASKDQKLLMRAKEDYYLHLQPL